MRVFTRVILQVKMVKIMENFEELIEDEELSKIDLDLTLLQIKPKSIISSWLDVTNLSTSGVTLAHIHC